MDEHFEFDRKNHAEEDAQIAQTIISGIEEYTEFKVAPPSSKEAGKMALMQYELNKKLVRLCIIRCFHPDKLMQEIRSFIIHFLDPGEKFIEPPQFNFENFIRTVKKKQPVMFMVGPNVNSFQELKQLQMTLPDP